jgi:hypothetical protein
MQFLVAAALVLSWMWPVVPGSSLGCLAVIAVLVLLAAFAVRKSRRTLQERDWPHVSGRINHVYPASFGRRVVLKLDCSWRAADGTVREQQHEYTTSRQRRDRVMEALYGAAVTLHVDPANDSVSMLLGKDVAQLLEPVGAPQAAEKSVPPSALGVDFASSAPSH